MSAVIDQIENENLQLNFFVPSCPVEDETVGIPAIISQGELIEIVNFSVISSFM